MKYLLPSFAGLISLVILLSCGSKALQSGKTEKPVDLWLNSHRPDVAGEFYLAQFSEVKGTTWDTLALNIEGFKYIPGSIYHLKVKELISEDNIKQLELIELMQQTIDPLQLIHDIYVLREMPGIDSEKSKVTRATLEINTNTMQMMGQAHCNSISAGIKELTETDIVFGPIMQSKMACPDLDLESEYTKRLSATRTYSRDALRLNLFDEKGEKILVFQKVD